MIKKVDKKIKLTAAFSTLELLIAMTILIMVLSAIIFISFGNQSLFVDNQTNAEALNKAQELIEQQQALARKDFKLVNPSGAITDGIYQKSVSVQNIDFFTKEVTSTVTWMLDKNRSQKIDLTTLVTNFENAVGGDTCHSVLSGDWTEPKIINTGNTSLATIVGNSSGSFPITDVDAYEEKLYVTVNNSTATNAGPSNPSAAANGAGVGSIAWSNESSVGSSDDSRASASLPVGSTTNYLKATNFGFSIPSWATITGIRVEVERSISGTTAGGVRDSEVKIIKADGSISANNNADLSTNWPVVGSESIATYNPSDLWGETWSPALINSSNFGVAIAATATSARTAQVDHIKITVSYIRQFYALDIDDPSDPTFSNSLGGNTIKTGLNAVAVMTNSTKSQAFVATNSSTGQFQILDLKTSPFSVISTLKVGTTAGVGNSIFFKDGYAYLGLTHNGVGPEFYIIDVHDPINPIVVGSATIGNDINAIYVKDSHAYLATPNTDDLWVFDVGAGNLSTGMSPDGKFSGTGGLHGKSVYVVGDTTYMGRTFGSNELYVLDGSDVSSISELGHVDTGSGSSTSVNSLIVRDYLAFLLNTAGAFQVWRVDNPTSITRYDTSPISVPSASGNNTPLDCEGDNFYAGTTDGSNKGYINVINTQ